MPITVTRVFAQVLATGSGDVTVTRAFAQVLATGSGDVTVTRAFAQILARASGDVDVTRIFAQVLTDNTGMGDPDTDLDQGDVPSVPDPQEETTILLKDENGNIFDLILALDASSVFIETRWLDLGDSHTDKHIRRVIAEILRRVEAPSLELIVKYKNKLSDASQQIAAQPLDTEEPVQVRVPGAKFHKYRFQDEAVRVAWKLAAFEIHGETGARRLR